MPGYILTLDPPSIIPGRTELSLNSGVISLEEKGVDWGDAEVQQYMAEQRYGQTPVSYRIPNRVITIPLGIGMGEHTEAEAEAARRQLQEKIGLIQREGGVLKRQTTKGEPLYADIVDAKLTLPDTFGERAAGVEPNVVLTLECLPDFYGEEVTLDAVEESGQIVSVLQQSGKQAVIAGDYPARARIVLTEGGGVNQKGLLWGLRCSHYEAAATSALKFDSYLLSTINGATTASEGGTTYTGKIVKLTTPEVNLWHPFLELKTAAGAHLTHLGSYRVWVRVKAAATGVKFRLVWSSDDATAPTYNEAMSVTQAEEYQLLDLGEIRLEEPPVGEHFWQGFIQVETGETAHTIKTDRIWLQPLDDGAGRLRATATPASSSLAPSATPGAGANNSTLSTGTAWTEPGNIAEGPESFAFVTGKTQSEALTATSLGFNIPSGAEIHGVEVKAQWATGNGAPTMETLLIKGSSQIGTGKTITGEGSITMGGPTDVWEGSAGLSPAVINASTFGVAFIRLSAPASPTALGEVSVRIYYSVGSSSTSKDAILYESRKAEVRSEGSYREDITSEAYVRASEETGDLVRLPPSGIENRPVELLIKNSRGLLPEPGGDEAGGEDGIDKIKAQVIYRPCYIGRI